MTEDKGFEVRDKRFATSEESETKETVQEDVGAAQDGQAAGAGQGDGGGGQALPQVNFPTFIISLSSSVLLHLGEMEDPETGKNMVNLPLAKQTIDILAMLEEKTKGNLADDEGQLLQNVLYDLRMRYVAQARK